MFGNQRRRSCLSFNTVRFLFPLLFQWDCLQFSEKENEEELGTWFLFHSLATFLTEFPGKSTNMKPGIWGLNWILTCKWAHTCPCRNGSFSSDSLNSSDLLVHIWASHRLACPQTSNLIHLTGLIPFFFFKGFIYLFLERGEGKEKERERKKH